MHVWLRTDCLRVSLRALEEYAESAGRHEEDGRRFCDPRQRRNSFDSPPSRLELTLSRYGGQPPSGLVNRSVGLDAHPRSKTEGWLANRSSLTNAGERRLVDQTSDSWNRLVQWMRQLEILSLGS